MEKIKASANKSLKFLSWNLRTYLPDISSFYIIIEGLFFLSTDSFCLCHLQPFSGPLLYELYSQQHLWSFKHVSITHFLFPVISLACLLIAYLLPKIKFVSPLQCHPVIPQRAWTHFVPQAPFFRWTSLANILLFIILLFCLFVCSINLFINRFSGIDKSYFFFFIFLFLFYF